MTPTLQKLTPADYLSGKHDEELRVLVAKTRDPDSWCWKEGFKDETVVITEPFSTSLDACRELLADLTEAELTWLGSLISAMAFKLNVEMGAAYLPQTFSQLTAILRVTAQQICVAYLIVKGVLE